MRIFFSVGEPSGDLHGSNLIRHLKSQTDVECVGFGGPKMRDAGCDLHYDLTTMAVMFFGEVIKNLRFFFGLVDQANDYFAENKVDAVVLIDYPGFNWWIARKAKKHDIPVFYYGVPQMWAWAPWRVRKLRKLVDHVLCKLPFEVPWFERRNCTATYVGHPYFDQIAHQKYNDDLIQRLQADQRPLVTLLPGSRNQEVASVLPILVSAAKRVRQQVPGCRVIVGSFNEKQAAAAKELIQEQQVDIEVMVDCTPELMKTSTLCLACSGSVSLELLHHRTPTIIVYKVKRWVMLAQSIMLRSKFITLVNLIATDDIRKKTWGPYKPDAPNAESAVMPEYLTTGDPSELVAARAIKWLTDEATRMNKVEQLNQLADRFAIPGATERAGDYLLQQLNVTPLQKTSVVPTPKMKQASSQSGKISDQQRSA